MHQIFSKIAVAFAILCLPRLSVATSANDNPCYNLLNRTFITLLDLNHAQVISTSSKREPLEQTFIKATATQSFMREYAKIYNEPPFAVVAGQNLVRIFRDPETLAIQFSTQVIAAPVAPQSPRKFPVSSSYFPLIGSPNGRYILTANANETVINLIDLELSRTMLELVSSADVGDGDYRAAIFKSHAKFSGDGKYLTVAHPDLIEVFDVSGLRPRLIHSVDLGWPIMNEDPVVDQSGPGRVAGYFPRGLRGTVQYLPETNELLAFYHGQAPQIFSVKNPAHHRVIELPERGVRDAIGLVDNQNHFGFSVRDQKVIDMFSLPGGLYLRSFYAHGPINEMAISPSGRYLAYAVGQDGGVGVFDLAHVSDVARFEIEIPTGQGSLLSFDGEHRLLCGVRELAEVYMFTLP